MREIKTFFVEDNRLNKGYSEDNIKSFDKKNYLREKLQNDLPPQDIMAAYEELHPGTFKKMLELFEKEQKHRHSIDELNLRIQQKAYTLGRFFGFFIICAIGYVVIQLVAINEIIAAGIYASLAFSCIFGVSIWSLRGSDRKHYRDRRNQFKRGTSSNNKYSKNFKQRRGPNTR